MVERHNAQDNPYIKAFRNCQFILYANDIDLNSKSEIFQNILKPLLLRLNHGLTNDIELNCLTANTGEIQRLQRQVGYLKKFVLQQIQYFSAFKTEGKFIEFSTFWSEMQVYELAKMGANDNQLDYVHAINALDKTSMLHTLFNLKIALDALSHDLRRIELYGEELKLKSETLHGKYKKLYPKYLEDPNLREKTKKFIQRLCPRDSKFAHLATDSNIAHVFTKAKEVLKLKDQDVTTDEGFKEAREVDWLEVFDLGLVAFFYSLGIAFLMVNGNEPALLTVGFGYLVVAYEAWKVVDIHTKKPLQDRENFVKAVITQLYLNPKVKQKLSLIKFKEFIEK